MFRSDERFPGNGQDDEFVDDDGLDDVAVDSGIVGFERVRTVNDSNASTHQTESYICRSRASSTFRTTEIVRRGAVIYGHRDSLRQRLRR